MEDKNSRNQDSTDTLSTLVETRSSSELSESIGRVESIGSQGRNRSIEELESKFVLIETKECQFNGEVEREGIKLTRHDTLLASISAKYCQYLDPMAHTILARGAVSV